ncbi:glycosyltransferase family protein [Bdellovibrio svalbardensis]|uniref:Uncharacterized protein n=1 Tax=Bdellovibrio svalbardensis TaxID=2972972 RepID=A0ABT6DG32_9BACT|nr:hypothetical protein [Bdellovibrio svalbardensis]MDG0815787.1 hypothetical protein [Bdellovibrio svalbardensis]
MILNQKHADLLNEQVAAGLRGDFQRGWQIAEELKSVAPLCRKAAFNRGWYEMNRGDLLAGLRCLDNGRWEKVFGDQPLPTTKPIYRNEDLRGKNLLLCGEGGLGDEILNIRFAQNFAEKGAQVTVTCDPSLMSVFARVPGVASVVAHRAAPDVFHDYWVPAMSAGSVLNTTYESLRGSTYLSVDREYDRKWQQIVSTKFRSEDLKLGLRFYGNSNFEQDSLRRFSPESLIQTLNGRPWVNLQKEETDLPMQSWEDTLGLLNQLDLVITSCTSVAHASAALGKETWVLVPIMPYYPWAQPGSTSGWYNSVRIFRQKTIGSWQAVFAEVHEALNERNPYYDR